MFKDRERKLVFLSLLCVTRYTCVRSHLCREPSGVLSPARAGAAVGTQQGRVFRGGMFPQCWVGFLPSGSWPTALRLEISKEGTRPSWVMGRTSRATCPTHVSQSGRPEGDGLCPVLRSGRLLDHPQGRT